jgi:hypothetical protein
MYKMRITESALRRIIREALFAEAAITPETAEERGITFVVDVTLRNIEITVIRGGDDTAVVGQLHAGKIEESRSIDQKGVWAINKSNSSIKGLGPLMYDLMIDLIHPASLVSDRLLVSKDAKRVWDYYMNNRNDVEALQLDNLEDELTPGLKDDNYDQNSAENWAFTDRQPWYDSSLSKAYRRKDRGSTPTLDALEGLGIIDIAR